VLLLAASNADLDALVQQQSFRADLLYRLNTVRVTLPPLRCRSDFAAAVRWVLQSLDDQARISDAAVQRLAQHSWPGNFRELRSVLTRLLLAHGDGTERSVLDLDAVAPVLPALPTSNGTPSALQRNADEAVRAAFLHNGHSVSRTSRALGISRTTVYRHLRQAGVIPD
jgi:sigma-54 dependent transcriptional regulator, acetoin dehydrogenase operon transcriptional activator AcoR